MVRAWQCALVISTACVLAGCQRLLSRLNPVEAGTTEEADAVAGPEGDASPSAPAASASGSAEPAHKLAGGRCASGEVAVMLQPDEETCVVECKSGSECPPNWACDGDGPLLVNGKPGRVVRFCRAVGHAKATDAGPAHSAVADAGKAAPVAEPPEAGANAKKLDVKMSGGQCPAGYHPCGAVCRLACAKDSECGIATAHCQGGFCMGPGSQPCGK